MQKKIATKKPATLPAKKTRLRLSPAKISDAPTKSAHGKIILKEISKYPESHLTNFEKMSISQKGISKSDLQKLKKAIGVDYYQPAKNLSVSRSTLMNKKSHETFSKPISEKILHIAEIYSYGYEVFEDEERFNKWIFQDNLALGGVTPLSLLNSQFGSEEVKNLIGRSEYGVFS